MSTLPETSDTDGLLNQQTLASLPSHAIFINVGRSNVVDHAALFEMLCNGKLAGAVLDVFDTEPLAENSEMWDVPNLSITAHIAAASHPALIAPIFVENYQRYRNSLPLNYIVDFDAGY